jgi:hypothetical protein
MEPPQPKKKEVIMTSQLPVAHEQLLSVRGLPQLPVLMHPLVGENIIERELLPAFHGQQESVGQVIADFRARHSPERTPYRRLYWTKPVRGNSDQVSVYYRHSFGRKKHSMAVGVTRNDPAAIRILIGNQLTGAYMTSIRWEVYEDPGCEELLDMGRFDQWDLLKGVSTGDLRLLAAEGIAPHGNWDFDQMLFEKTCSVCGSIIKVNGFAFNIDSAVCAKCGNRPCMASWIHGHFDVSRDHDDKHAWLHLLEWMSHVGASFGQIRKDAEDVGGNFLKGLFQKTLIAQAMDPATADHVRGFFASNTTIDFEMYRRASEQLKPALLGEIPFTDEHRIAADFVLKATELLRVRHLTTNVR